MKVITPFAVDEVAVFALTGCGNAAAKSAPDDASHEDFCVAADELLKADDKAHAEAYGRYLVKACEAP